MKTNLKTYPILTATEGIQAIRARLTGTWDDPVLMRMGPLSENASDDVNTILFCVGKASGDVHHELAAECYYTLKDISNAAYNDPYDAPELAEKCVPLMERLAELYDSIDVTLPG